MTYILQNIENFKQQDNQEKISEFENLSGLDLSKRDLKAVSAEVLDATDFDTTTKWPRLENLPVGFNPELLIEENKNPGLGIRDLHKQGIDGRGIKLAIIDQTLSPENGEIMPHTEYFSRKEILQIKMLTWTG